MNKSQKNKRILLREIKMYLSQEFQYKGQLFAWLIADIVKITVLCFIWIAASKISGVQTQGYIVSYYIILIFVSKFTSDYTMEFGVRNILSGKFSNYLLKPFNYLLEYIGTNIGSNLIRVFLFLPAFILAVLWASKSGLFIAEFNPFLMVLAILAMIIGFVINLLLGNIVSLLAMGVKEMDGVRIFYYNVASILSGEIIPLVFLPMGARFFAENLPFRYTLSFPVEILLGTSTDYQIEFGFVVGIASMILLIFVYGWVYKLVKKKYEAEGL